MHVANATTTRVWARTVGLTSRNASSSTPQVSRPSPRCCQRPPPPPARSSHSTTVSQPIRAGQAQTGSSRRTGTSWQAGPGCSRAVTGMASLSHCSNDEAWSFQRPGGIPMRIHEVLAHKPSHDVVTVRPDATVRELLGMLAEYNIGALVVSADGAAVDGIVSERDVVRRLHADERVLDAAVSTIMSSQVQTCEKDATVDELMSILT